MLQKAAEHTGLVNVNYWLIICNSHAEGMGDYWRG